MKDDGHIVFIVVDDVRIREARSGLPASCRDQAVEFGPAGEHVDADEPSLPAFLSLFGEVPDIKRLNPQK